MYVFDRKAGHNWPLEVPKETEVFRMYCTLP